jgi:nickel-dependent lactate racemase
MFGDLPQNLFKEHRWRTDCVQTGTIPADYIESVSDGTVSYDLPVFFNKILFDQKYDCILSISQVVPHEVAGMAGYTKNIFVGLGGSENIHKTHFLGAAYGMETIMGRAGTPVRQVFNHAVKTFLSDLPIVHIITVLGMASDGTLKVRGLFIGNDDECYNKAAQLSQTVNIHQLDKPLKKVVVHLDPLEFKSTWLGNKSIYRTRMAIADNGELLILAPGVKMFGEDLQIDALIRQFGYRGTPFTMDAINNHDHLKNNLSAAAHLIHGSSEDRFKITYCTGGMDKSTIENVGFLFESVDHMIERYNPLSLSEGFNTMPDGEEIYYISAPGSGLWACKEKFC